MLGAFCLFFPALPSCEQFVQPVVAPQAIVRRAAAFSHRTVRVIGIVKDMRHRRSHAGVAYDVFLLCDDACVQIFLPERADLRDGDTVSVSGLFTGKHTVGKIVYREEIAADQVVIERLR